MNPSIKPFSNLDKSLRDTIIIKNVTKLNLGLLQQIVDTVLNTVSDIDFINQVNKILESSIVELNDIYEIKIVEDESEKK